MIASDCKSVVTEIDRSTSGPYSTVIKEINQTKEEFESCSFSHESRSSNMEAHHLAKHALHLSEGRHLWLINPYDTTVIPVNLIVNQ